MRSFPSVVLHPHLQFPSDFSNTEEDRNYSSWRKGVCSEVNLDPSTRLAMIPSEGQVNKALNGFISTKWKPLLPRLLRNIEQ